MKYEHMAVDTIKQIVHMNFRKQLGLRVIFGIACIVLDKADSFRISSIVKFIRFYYLKTEMKIFSHISTLNIFLNKRIKFEHGRKKTYENIFNKIKM